MAANAATQTVVLDLITSQFSVISTPNFCHGGRLAVMNGQICILGGEHNWSKLVFDGSKWETDRSIFNLAFHSQVTCDDINPTIITFGGKTRKGVVTNGMLHFFISQNSAVEYAGDPPPRIHHSAVVYLHYIIIYGGEQGGSVFSDIWVYDIDAKHWKPVAGAFPPRTRHTAVIVGTWMLVIGGQANIVDPALPIFGINLRSWTLHPFVPLGNYFTRMAGHAACVAGDRIFVFGGYQCGKQKPLSRKPLKLFNTFLVMDIPQVVLESRTELPELEIPDAAPVPRGRRKSEAWSTLWAPPPRVGQSTTAAMMDSRHRTAD
jgi:hypothetical protein